MASTVVIIGDIEGKFELYVNGNKLPDVVDFYISGQEKDRASVSITLEPDVIQTDLLTDDARAERVRQMQEAQANQADEGTGGEDA